MQKDLKGCAVNKIGRMINFSRFFQKNEPSSMSCSCN